MDLEKQVTLNELCGGALQERFVIELQKVMENVADYNTPWKDKRSINITVDFLPNEDRTLTSSELNFKTKLAQVSPIKTTFLIGEDGSGKVISAEYQKQAKGQTYVDPTTGEISVPSGFNRVANPNL